MPKVTKILGYNKARAWESLGFAHKKRLCQHFDTTSCYGVIISYTIWGPHSLFYLQSYHQ